MWNLLIGSGGSIVADAIIFLISYWYNSKRQSDAKANEYTRLINEIANLNSKFTIMDSKIDNVDTKFDILDSKFAILDSKIENASESTNNHYTRLMNE
ncbi:hypothetical protein F4X73_00645, partial [Candidatus Poribacteria bacterium]|nr:hypothetical protein [Candidatus Poribacteria bacterium]